MQKIIQGKFPSTIINIKLMDNDMNKQTIEGININTSVSIGTNLFKANFGLGLDATRMQI